MEIDIFIDSLTNCLTCSETGEEFDTEFREISINSKFASQLQKCGWGFNWSVPYKDYMLYISKVITKFKD